jgi:hypothetical protein
MKQTISADYAMASNNEILHLFQKYQGWMEATLVKMGFERGDATGEAYLVFDRVFSKLDLSNVQDKRHWSIHLFLQRGMITLRKKLFKQSAPIKAVPVDGGVLGQFVTDSRPSFVSKILCQFDRDLMLTKLPKSLKSEKKQQIVSLLLQGFSQSETAAVIGCSRQYVSGLVVSHKRWFLKYLQ